jgi:NADP-dependent 3-hydroxy acid dehydrogenase YdfG
LTAIDIIQKNIDQTKTGPVDLEFIPLDLNDLESVKKFAELVKQKYKKVDILINNAGMFG